MTPIPPAAVLFLLQSGYSAVLVMQIAVDSINGVANESKRYDEQIEGHEQGQACQYPITPAFINSFEAQYQ